MVIAMFYSAQSVEKGCCSVVAVLFISQPPGVARGIVQPCPDHDPLAGRAGQRFAYVPMILSRGGETGCKIGLWETGTPVLQLVHRFYNRYTGLKTGLRGTGFCFRCNRLYVNRFDTGISRSTPV